LHAPCAPPGKAAHRRIRAAGLLRTLLLRLLLAGRRHADEAPTIATNITPSPDTM